MTEEKKQEEVKEGGSSNMKMIIIAVVLSLVISGVVVGVVLYVLGDKLSAQPAATVDGEVVAEVVKEELAPAEYMSLDPKFTVTFKNQQHARFMQFSVEIMTRDEEIVKGLKAHMPAIRSSLVLLFGVQEYEKMSTREGKELLLVEVTEDINKTLEKVMGKTGVDSAYFHSFLIQ